MPNNLLNFLLAALLLVVCTTLVSGVVTTTTTTAAPLSTTAPILTSWIKCTGVKYGTSGILTDVLAIAYTSTTVYIVSEGVPSYTIGPWANPNQPSAQNFSFSFPAYPSPRSGTKVGTAAGSTGVFTNGMVLYKAGDGMSYNSKGTWNQLAPVFEASSFDSCLGHADVQGIYHNHPPPICLYSTSNPTVHSPIIGFAFDGYPIYGPFGYSNASSASSGVRRMTPSYYKRSITNRTELVNGTVLPASYYGPPVSTSYPLGSYYEDYAYTAGYGDLDECNGRWSVTPEYPSGTYAYFSTVDASFNPIYPYVMGTCYYGNPTRPNGHVSAPANYTIYFQYGTTTSSNSTTSYSSSTRNIQIHSSLLFFIITMLSSILI